MARVVVTAQVEDAVKWEKSFRTHGDLFRSQTVTKPINFATIEGNMVALCGAGQPGHVHEDPELLSDGRRHGR